MLLQGHEVEAEAGMKERDVRSLDVHWDGPILRVCLNRAEKLNALNLELLQELLAVQADLANHEEVRVMLLTGAGRVFCAGADLEYINGIYEDPVASRTYLYTLRDAILGMERLTIPVIAAVHGVVLAGGLELMLGCDLVLAAESTRLADQHMNFGFIPGGGSTQRLARWIGPARAHDLLFTGRWLTAPEALQMGLISRVVPDSDLKTGADELATDLSRRVPHAMARTKALVRHALAQGLEQGLDLEIETVLSYYNSPEFRQCLQAFQSRKSVG
jgi:enoyl-CoA hydratase